MDLSRTRQHRSHYDIGAPRGHGADWGGTANISLGDLNRDGIADLARYHTNGHLYVYPGRGSVEPGVAFWAPRDHGGTRPARSASRSATSTATAS